MSAYQIDALKNNPKVTVIEGEKIAKLNRDADGKPQTMETDKGRTLEVKAIGQFLGSVPETKWVPASVPAQGWQDRHQSKFRNPASRCLRCR